MDRKILERLSKDELITLVLAQAAQIAALTERIAALEAKLGQPPKTPDNSSVPPSRGQKLNRAEQRKAKPKGRPGSFRALSETPDRTITVLASACPHCDHALSAGDQPTVHAYDHIDLPPIAVAGVPESYRTALRARLENLSRLGVRKEASGKETRVSYDFDDVCLWAFCLELAQFGMDPARVAMMSYRL